MAEEGINILFTHYKAESEWAQLFQTKLQAMNILCDSLEINLAESGAATKVLNKAFTSGVPNILINNAAHSTRDGYQILSAKIIDEHYAVNVRTPMLLCAEFAKRLKDSSVEAGRIINMTSGQDLGPMTEELAYVASKGAMSAFTRSFSAEVAHLGITVNAINPGPTDTGWMTDDIKEHLRPKFLMGRIGLPQDTARLVSFLVSKEGGWITGQVLHSEGGFLRS